MDLKAAARGARRAIGAGLVAVAFLPVYRLLADPATGPAGRATVSLADAAQPLLWWGTLLVAGLSLLLARGLPGVDPGRLGGALGERLASLAPRALALGAGLLAGGLCLAVGHWVFRGYPTLLDEMAQLLQARYFEGGLDAGPPPEPAAAWLIQNTLITRAGWVSQYPPFQTRLLSLGLAFGAPWLVGPMLTATVAFFTALIARRLLPERPAVASWGALLVAASPFVLTLGAGYLSHVPTAALAAAGLWWSLRATDGRAPWALATGLCCGLAVATRPWTGLVLSGVITLGVWVPEVRSRGVRWFSARAGLAALGTLPGGLWLAAYNARVFGGPFRFGYAVAQGPNHGLGFHSDPWGNAYGPIQAVGYTAADLLHLGIHLLETPIPLVAVVGAFLWVTPSLSRGTRLLSAWALAPVAANLFYWHHGFHLGPRMLYEASPAWILLGVVAVFGLMDALPPGWSRRSLRWGVVLSVAGALSLGIPDRLRSYRWTPETLERITMPSPASASLVFVHGGWAGRLTARLAGLGMRLDSVETAIRRNDACALQAFTDTWASGTSREAALAAVPLSLEPLPGDGPGLDRVPVGAGSVIRVDPRRPPSDVCRAQARSDRMGVIELAPLLWQGDLPGAEEGRPMFVRDLGPTLNEAVLADYPDRPAYVFTALTPDAPPELVPYEQGMQELWLGGGGP